MTTNGGGGVVVSTPCPQNNIGVFLKGEIDEDRSETKKYVFGSILTMSMQVDSISFFSYLLHAFGTSFASARSSGSIILVMLLVTIEESWNNSP